jgi:hypothetical protein
MTGASYQGFEQDEDTVSDVCGWCGFQAGDSVIYNLVWYTYWHNRDWQNLVYSIDLMTRSRTTLMVLSPPKCSNFLKRPGYQRFWKVSPTKAPDYPYSVRLSGSCTRSLVSCDQCLWVNITGLLSRESLNDTLRDLLPWDMEFVIDETVDE